MLAATHDGSFHADEVFAIAALGLLGDPIKVLRTRDRDAPRGRPDLRSFLLVAGTVRRRSAAKSGALAAEGGQGEGGHPRDRGQETAGRGDHEGGQGTISRFILTPGEEDGQWHCSVVCHWGSRASTRASATSTEVAETWTAGTHVDQGDRRSMPNSV